MPTICSYPVPNGKYAAVSRSQSLSVSTQLAGRWQRFVQSSHFELIFAIIILVANAPLFWGGSTGALAFFPANVAAGEWWRILTHPFVHISWYHLLLDGSAFLMLCAELRHWRAARRVAAIGTCAAGSLLATFSSPVLWQHGFGGLSGVAHGLMAISSLEMITCDSSEERPVGWCCFIGLLIKGTSEAITGNVVLSFLHFGLVGSPIAACHAGGIIGGLVFYLAVRLTGVSTVDRTRASCRTVDYSRLETVPHIPRVTA